MLQINENFRVRLGCSIYVCVGNRTLITEVPTCSYGVGQPQMWFLKINTVQTGGKRTKNV